MVTTIDPRGGALLKDRSLPDTAAPDLPAWAAMTESPPDSELNSVRDPVRDSTLLPPPTPPPVLVPLSRPDGDVNPPAPVEADPPLSSELETSFDPTSFLDFPLLPPSEGEAPPPPPPSAPEAEAQPLTDEQWEALFNDSWATLAQRAVPQPEMGFTEPVAQPIAPAFSPLPQQQPQVPPFLPGGFQPQQPQALFPPALLQQQPMWPSVPAAPLQQQLMGQSLAGSAPVFAPAPAPAPVFAPAPAPVFAPAPAPAFAPAPAPVFAPAPAPIPAPFRPSGLSAAVLRAWAPFTPLCDELSELHAWWTETCLEALDPSARDQEDERLRNLPSLYDFGAFGELTGVAAGLRDSALTLAVTRQNMLEVQITTKHTADSMFWNVVDEAVWTDVGSLGGLLAHAEKLRVALQMLKTMRFARDAAHSFKKEELDVLEVKARDLAMEAHCHVTAVRNRVHIFAKGMRSWLVYVADPSGPAKVTLDDVKSFTCHADFASLVAATQSQGGT